MDYTKPVSLETFRELQSIWKHYSSQPFLSAEQNTKGNVNTTYILNAGNRYILRKSYHGCNCKSLVFEAGILNYLTDTGFTIVPRIVHALNKLPFTVDHNGQLVTLFSHLPGTNTYSWHENNCTPKELQNAFQTLGRFHSHLVDYFPEDIRGEQPIDQKIKAYPYHLLSYQDHYMKDNSAMGTYLQFNAHLILEQYSHASHILDAVRYQDIPKHITHCDFHLGNLFFENEQVVGLIDFDWAQYNTFLWDLAFSINQICSDWDDVHQVNPDKARIAVASYQETAPPLPESWKQLLSRLLYAAESFQLDWTISSYYDKGREERYIDYFFHTMESLKQASYQTMWD